MQDFTEEEFHRLEDIGLGLEGGNLYRELFWPIAEQTMPTLVCNDPESMETLSWGNKGIRSLRIGSFHWRGRHPERMVFMEEVPPLASPSESGGFLWNTRRPRQGLREIASSRLAEHLAPALVPRCEVAVMGPWLGVARPFVEGLPPRVVLHQTFESSDFLPYILQAITDNSEEQWFSTMQFILAEMGIPGIVALLHSPAPGKLSFRREGRVILPFSDSRLRASLFRLQILDAACGQVDRHGGNYLISSQGDGWRVSAIDNQKSFWSEIIDPRQSLPECASENDVFHGVHLPPVLDEESASAVLDLMGEEPAFEEISPFLDLDELVALKSRWTCVFRHVADLARRDCIIPIASCAEAEEWALRAGCPLTPGNCYFVRDAQLLHDAGWKVSLQEASNLMGCKSPSHLAPGMAW